ncbi:hypothetical protein CKF54_05100 [Psittacicella hinzii]|uniref:Uncharacterized protein n=1 Tax=Psittacicella hinzii TaxID=2028575 RepID=A0A3A1Y4Z7_9GAMM|nr:hypothetical protein [Psittacicella hinzii]RIY32288.1 hypothetical protein CKF54_05100 [Psittacicella hinzii]
MSKVSLVETTDQRPTFLSRLGVALFATLIVLVGAVVSFALVLLASAIVSFIFSVLIGLATFALLAGIVVVGAVKIGIIWQDLFKDK